MDFPCARLSVCSILLLPSLRSLKVDALERRDSMSGMAISPDLVRTWGSSCVGHPFSTFCYSVV